MDPLELVRLPPLMSRSQGRRDVSVALIDGPVALDLPDLAPSAIHVIPAGIRGSCSRAESAACAHGTFVAGILAARRGSVAPAICPGCSLIVRPIFAENTNADGPMPGATPHEVARAIAEAVDAGASVINLSAALVEPVSRGASELERALDYTIQRGVLVVAAAGNQGAVGSSVITHHPWVLPVIGCDQRGRPTTESNLGNSIGRLGLSAPGANVTSLGTDGRPRAMRGTSVAAPFVTGAIALLWSEFPTASAARIKLALTQRSGSGRHAIIPPLLDAWAAHQALNRAHTGS